MDDPLDDKSTVVGSNAEIYAVKSTMLYPFWHNCSYAGFFSVKCNRSKEVYTKASLTKSFADRRLQGALY